MAPKPPNVRDAPAEPWRRSVARALWGPDMAPQTPQRSSPPGKAGVLLAIQLLTGPAFLSSVLGG